MKKISFVLVLLLSALSVKATVTFSGAGLSLKPGESAQLEVSMTNDAALAGFQFDIVLPEGITVQGNTKKQQTQLCGILDELEFDYSVGTTSGGHYGIRVYSLDGQTIPPSEGKILTVNMKAGENMTPGEKEIRLTNIILSQNGQAVDLDDVVISCVISSAGKKTLILDSLSYTLPDKEILYDGERHFATVDVTDEMGQLHIYYTDEPGVKTEAQPVAAGTYSVSFEFEENDLYHAARFDDIWQFTIDSLPARQWEILQEVCQELGQAGDWLHKWDLSKGIEGAGSLYGITYKHGNIVSVDLSDSQIEGAFPFSLLKLPCLDTLCLSGNQLSGDVGQGMLALIQENPSLTVALRKLDVTGNQLSGNIGAFAAGCSYLESLLASGNRLEDVSPVIPASVTELDLSAQDMQRAIDFHLTDMTDDDQMQAFIAQLPTLLFYNHAAQSYDTGTSVVLSEANDRSLPSDKWHIRLALEDGRLTLGDVSAQNVYRGESGATVYAFAPNGHTLSVRLGFSDGDSNFNGVVDVTDLQADVNFIFEEYNSQKAYNFTAANLWVDEEINAQDLVKLVDVLMLQEPAASRKGGSLAIAGQRRGRQEPEAATVCCSGGQLVVSTTVPVAAFDVTVTDCTTLTVPQALAQMGFLCTVRQTAGGMRIIGFSLTGAVLPVGDNVIGHTAGAAASVVRAVLSDSDAEIISTSTGGQTTTIETAICPEVRSGAAYRLPVGAGKAVVIDHHGRKTFETHQKGVR